MRMGACVDMATAVDEWSATLGSANSYIYSVTISSCGAVEDADP